MDFSQTRSILQRIPMLACLSAADQKLLAFTSQLLTYENGEVIFHINEPATDVFLVVEGTVEQRVITASEDVHAGTIGAFQLFGEMAVIRHVPRLVTVRAKGPAKVLRLEGEMFLQMVVSTPKAAMAVMKEMAQKITTLVDKHKGA